MQGKAPVEKAGAEASAEAVVSSPEAINEELKKLDKIESALQTERSELQKQLASKEKKGKKSAAIQDSINAALSQMKKGKKK